MLAYKIDVLETLKEAGYNTTRLRKEKLLNESAIQYIRCSSIKCLYFQYYKKSLALYKCIGFFVVSLFML